MIAWIICFWYWCMYVSTIFINSKCLSHRWRLVNRVPLNSSGCWRCSVHGNCVLPTSAQQSNSAGSALSRCRSTSTKNGSAKRFQTSSGRRLLHLSRAATSRSARNGDKRITMASREPQPGQLHQDYTRSEIDDAWKYPVSWWWWCCSPEKMCQFINSTSVDFLYVIDKLVQTFNWRILIVDLSLFTWQNMTIYYGFKACMCKVPNK